jgi:hypothetical protein
MDLERVQTLWHWIQIIGIKLRCRSRLKVRRRWRKRLRITRMRWKWTSQGLSSVQAICTHKRLNKQNHLLWVELMMKKNNLICYQTTLSGKILLVGK